MRVAMVGIDRARYRVKSCFWTMLSCLISSGMIWAWSGSSKADLHSKHQLFMFGFHSWMILKFWTTISRLTRRKLNHTSATCWLWKQNPTNNFKISGKCSSTQASVHFLLLHWHFGFLSHHEAKLSHFIQKLELANLRRYHERGVKIHMNNL
jgi:hypothetical protein